MANIYPSQDRQMDPYTSYFSSNVNKLTRVVSLGTDCILSNDQIDVINDSTALTTNVIVTPGSCIKDDVLIKILDDFNVDFEEQSFYISGSAFNEAGIYYIILDFTYILARPAPQASIKILKPSQHSFLTDQYMFIKAVNVIFTGSVFEISELLDFDPGDLSVKRVYTQTFATLENYLPIYDSSIDKGKIIYDRSVGIAYLGGESDWQPLGAFDYECDTSLCADNQLVYIGASNQAHPAIASSASYLAIGFVLIGGESVGGKVRITGRVDNGLVQTGITISDGDTLYLSTTEAGTVTNIEPPGIAQIIGICIHTSTGSDYSCILCSLSGSSGGTTTHNLLSGLEGGDSTHYYHLSQSQYDNLGDGLHNSLSGIQGGDSTGIYHLTYPEYLRVTSFGGNHNGLPTGLQGGSVTERYHFTQTEHDNLNSFGGNHNNCPTGLQGGGTGEFYHLTHSQHHIAVDLQSVALYTSPLKAYITSLLSYGQDDRNLKDRYDPSLDPGNSQIYGDIITDNTNGSFVEQNGLANTCQIFSGIFGLINNSYSRSYGSQLSEGKDNMGGLSLTYRYGIIAGGENATSVISSVDRLDNSTGNWTSRTSMNYKEKAPSGLTFSSDFGVIVGGYNSGYTTSNQRYQDSTNTWVDRLAFTGNARSTAGSISLTSTYGLISGGGNGTSIFNDSFLFNETSNTWTSKNSMTYNRQSAGSFSLTDFSGIICGGYNSSDLDCTELYNYNLDIWTLKAPMLVANSLIASLSMTSDIGVVINGNKEINARFSNSQNSWTPRPSHMGVITNQTGISQLSDEGIVAGGHTGAGKVTSVLKYKDTEILALRSGFKDITTICETPTPVHHYHHNEIITNNLTNQGDSINKVIISSLYNKKDTSDAIICQITMGGGNYINTYLDTITDTSTLLPEGSYYKYRLSIILTPDGSANVWTSRSSMIEAKYGTASFALDSDTTITAAGYNGTGTNTAFKFSDSGNLWTSTAGVSTPSRDFVFGFKLTNYFGIIAGGANASALSYTDRYTNAGGSAFWTTRGSLNTGRTDPSGFPLNYQQGLINGGNNLITGFLYSSERFTDVLNSWTFRNPSVIGKDGSGGISLTKNLGVLAGGSNSVSQMPYVERYSDSDNSWSSRTELLVTKDDVFEMSFNYNTGMICAGFNNYVPSSNNESQLYSDGGNVWSMRANVTTGRSAASGSSMTSHLGLGIGGANPSILSTTERYTYGEVSFMGFATIPLI